MNNKIKKIIYLILLIMFTCSIVEKSFQNDTFFYIPIGKYIAENKTIDGIDHWTFHNNLKFTYPGWICDLVFFYLNDIFGYRGIYILVLILASFVALTIFNILNKNHIELISFVVSIIIIYLSRAMFVARNQIFSFLVFVLELYFLKDLLEDGRKRSFWILILLSFILVNIHDTLFPVFFVILMPYLAEIVLKKFKFSNRKLIYTELKNEKYIVLLIILSSIIGLFTPLFGTAYTNAILCLSGVSTNFISELKSINILENLYLLFVISFTIMILIFSDTKIKIKDLLFVAGFVIFAIITSRNIYFLYLIGSISFFDILIEFGREYNIEEQRIIKFQNSKLFNLILLLLILLISIYNFSNQLYHTYVDDSNYPVDATNWIIENVEYTEARIWTHFNFGSYLELKGIKVFLDSRSGMFCKEVNNGVTILEDWLAVTDGQVNYREIFNKYEITHVLLYNTELINQYIFYDDDYELVYQDDIFSLYERK